MSLVSIMATREPYTTAFDEDVQTDCSANQCPECDGRVTTNAVETVCEGCGLVIDEQRIDHGPEWRTFDEDECKRTGAPLTATRHDRGLSTEIGRGKDANGNALSGRKRRQVARMRREQTRGRFQSKPNEISHTDWARSAGWRVPSSSPIRSVTRRVNCSGALKLKICFEADPSKPSPRPACTGPAAVMGFPGYWTRLARWPASRNLELRTRTKR